jgi:hypothetical protein
MAQIILTIPDDQLHYVLFGIHQATEGMNKSIQIIDNTPSPVDGGSTDEIIIHRKLAEHQQRSLHQKVNP